MRFMWQGDPPERLLTECFHIETGFHPGQREIIERLVQGKRVLAIQRTGWGKSLCYQIASLYYPYLTIIFSPLKALMRDQCQPTNFPLLVPSQRIQEAAGYFLGEDWLPRIEKRGVAKTPIHNEEFIL